MDKGAFALLDCLGFKGIWERYDPQAIIQKLRAIEKIIEKDCSPLASGFAIINSKRIVTKVKLLSDTVALSVTFHNAHNESESNANYLLGFISLLIVRINSHFLLHEPHLVLRGCVTFGDHLFEENFILGPAVDRAAEYEKLPNGAFIWLDPKATELYRQNKLAVIKNIEKTELVKGVESNFVETVSFTDLNTSPNAHKMAGQPPTVIEEYGMPIKNGEKLFCSIINPLAQEGHPDVRQQTIDIYKVAMSSDRLDVVIKRQNTLQFLNHSTAVTEDYYQKLTKHIEEFRNL